MPLQDLTPQLRTRLRRVEKVVGLFVAVATLLLLAGFVYYVYHTAQSKGWFVQRVPYHTYVMSAEGLAEGDPIVMMGFTVGELTKIEAMPPDAWYPVYVEFTIRRPYYGYIWTDTKLKIASAGFLGKRRIELVKGYEGKPTVREQLGKVTGVLVKNEYVPPDPAKPLYLAPTEEPALTERADKLLAQVEAALPSILGLTNQLATVLNNTATITANAAQLTANIDKLVVAAQPLVADARLIVTNLQTQLDDTFDNVNTNLATLATSLNLTLGNVADITSNLNVQVQSNDRILTEISELVIETNEMIQGLKRHWLLKGAFAEPAREPGEQLLEPQLTP